MIGFKIRVSAVRQSVMIIFLSLIVVMSSGYRVFGESLSLTYEFGSPKLDKVTIGDKTYDEVTVAGLSNSGLSGEPNLPSRGACILLPYNGEVNNIRVAAAKKIMLGAGLLIEPVQRAYPISTDPASISPVEPMSSVYNTDKPFPVSPAQEVSTQIFRGYRILIMKIIPFEYLPATGELYYFPELTVTVECTESEREAGLYRNISCDKNSLLQKIDNPQEMFSYEGYTGRGGSKNYDLLIITTPMLFDYFMPLKDYHDTTGILTDMVTTDQIGSTNPDDIRDYIRDRYLNDGIEYVLIGGDDDLIPAKDLYLNNWEVISYDMPGDFYFSCLDGTFNYDGDEYSGEPTDGENGGDVDLMAEVYVGRAPAGNPAEAYTFVEKTIQYLNTSNSYLNKSLLVGEALGYAGIQEYGGYLLDELIDSSSTNAYRTIGIPSNLYAFDMLYDRDWPGHDWPLSEIADRINSEYHLINHMGHSNTDYNMKMSPTFVMAYLNNENLSFMYSQGCYAGNFDNSVQDCMAEYYTVKSSHCAFAVIMNARYGWKEFFRHVNTTDGPSQRYHREFWDAVFNPDENMPELGRANQDSKEDNLYRINEGAMRWVYYELNLFGDPTVAIKRFPGLAFEFPSGLPLFDIPNQPAIFTMNVSGKYGGVPVPASAQLHYYVNDGDYQIISIPEVSTNSYEVTLPAITCSDSIMFCFSAEEAESGRLYYSHPDSPFVFTAVESTVTIFFDDFETDQGWAISDGLWARGAPTGGGGEYGRPDPSGCYSGTYAYGYNLEGDYENSLPGAHLTSPSFDCSGQNRVKLKFMRWLNVEPTPYDYASISISNDGTNWPIIWQNVGNILDSAWTRITLDISEYAANQENVQIRWTMGPTNTAWRYSGWNIDDVEIVSVICNEETFMCGDANGDETVNILDITYMISYLYKDGSPPDPLEAADVNNSGDVNILDITYLIANLYKGGPEPNCP